MITPERAREALAYDPETGIVTWAIRTSNRVKIGDAAGTPDRGYLNIGLDGESYRAHNLIWLYVTGEWPEHEIDHINGVKDDNRWVNLRDRSHTINMRNIVAPLRSGSSGFRGVSKYRKRWRAQIKTNNKNKHLGTFDTPEEASAAYWAAKAELHGVETYQGRLNQALHPR